MKKTSGNSIAGAMGRFMAYVTIACIIALIITVTVLIVDKVASSFRAPDPDSVIYERIAEELEDIDDKLGILVERTGE